MGFGGKHRRTGGPSGGESRKGGDGASVNLAGATRAGQGEPEEADRDWSMATNRGKGKRRADDEEVESAEGRGFVR